MATLTMDRVERGLGWFSVGLGMAELLAPRKISRLVGARNHSALVRGYGLRELTAGIGILASNQRAPWLWARVGGDVLDLVALARTAKSTRRKGKAAFAIASVAGVTALDICCAARQSKAEAATTTRAEASMIVNKQPEECYRFWRDLPNLARFLMYIDSVQNRDGGRSHWVAAPPGGQKIEWDSEITQDEPGQRIAWRSSDGAPIQHSGAVDFEAAPGNRGTIVRVQIDYGPAFPFAEQLVRRDLRRFKQAIETGEVITTEGQPAGRTESTTWLDLVAR